MSSVACVIAAAAAGAAAMKRNWNKDEPKEEVKKKPKEMTIAVKYALSFEGFEAFKLQNDIPIQLSYSIDNIEPQPISYNKISIAPETRALVYYIRFYNGQIEKFGVQQLECKAVEFMNKHPKLIVDTAQIVEDRISRCLDNGVDIEVARKYGIYETQIDTEVVEFRYTDEESKLNNSYVIDYMEVD